LQPQVKKVEGRTEKVKFWKKKTTQKKAPRRVEGSLAVVDGLDHGRLRVAPGGRRRSLENRSSLNP